MAGTMTVRSIERFKVEHNESEAYKEVLDKARNLFGYTPGAADYRLDAALCELEIECLSSTDVEAYAKSKETNTDKWKYTDISKYHLPIPVHVLNKMIQIKEVLPEAEFQVYHLAEDPDPFLWVSVAGWGRFIEVWDEPEFEGRKQS